nr:RHS repeat-associated core domain-containing protein [Shigella flexneri]
MRISPLIRWPNLLCHYRFRYYDCETGQYLCADPIGLSGGVNLYNYAPNPLVWIDPLGLLAGPGEDLYVGTYGSSIYANGKTGLNATHTPHHAIQDAVSPTTKCKGITINLRKDLHALTSDIQTSICSRFDKRTIFEKGYR